VPEKELLFLTALNSDSSHAQALLSLSKTEKEVLRYYLQGLSMPEIAKKRFRSTRTIENHVDSIKGKLGLTSRSEIFDFLGRIHGFKNSYELLN
jgi:DNA-binding NarL/FixJ family response regulator